MRSLWGRRSYNGTFGFSGHRSANGGVLFFSAVLLLIFIIFVVIVYQWEETINYHLHSNNTSDDYHWFHVVEGEEIVNGIAHNPWTHIVGWAVHEGFEYE